jgi:hypothetical protein
MVDRKSLRFSAVLLIAGEVVYQVAQQFHPEGGITAQDVFTSYANSPSWTLVHEAQFAGSAILIFGILALFFALNVNSGIRGRSIALRLLRQLRRSPLTVRSMRWTGSPSSRL